MQTLFFETDAVNVDALDAALHASLGDTVVGVTISPGDPLRVHLEDGATDADVQTARDVVVAHDPVHMGADKTVIQADGADEVTVVVWANSPVTLRVAGIATDPLLVPVALDGGIGEVGITASDPGEIQVTVASGENRCAQTLTIQAV